MNETESPRLSVVVPVRDEEETLDRLLAEIRDALEPCGFPFEVVVVDDGSTDGSADRLRRLRVPYPELRCVHFGAPKGQSAAVLAGLRAARGMWIATMDGDLQNDPREIPNLLDRLGEFDAVVGIRTRRDDPWLRRVSSRVANAVRNRVTRDDIVDTGCSLRVFRRECASAIPPFDGMHRFVPTLFRMAGYRVLQVGVNHRPRRAGRTKYGVWNRVFIASYDLLAVRWMMARYIREDPPP